jgi:hypothetical protein
MMSIMTELTAEGTREGGFNSIVISPLTPVVISPLGVLILVSPSRLVFVGGDSRLGLCCYCSCFFLSFWHYSIDRLDFLYSSVQNFDIAKGERVEQNSPQHEGVGEPWAVEDQGMEITDSVGVMISKVHRKAWCFR